MLVLMLVLWLQTLPTPQMEWMQANVRRQVNVRGTVMKGGAGGTIRVFVIVIRYRLQRASRPRSRGYWLVRAVCV